MADSGPSREVEQVHPTLSDIHSFDPTHRESRWYANILIPAAVSDRSFDNADKSAVPYCVLKDRPNECIEPNPAIGEKRSNWKSTVSATAKFLLRVVRDSADLLVRSSLLPEVYTLFWKIARYAPLPIPHLQHSQAVQRMNVNQK